MKTELKPPLPIGTKVKGWGELVGIHSNRGERLYFFKDKHGGIGLCPAELIDGWNIRGD